MYECEKTVYLSSESASTASKSVKHRGLFVRPYKCNLCDGWHLTTYRSRKSKSSFTEFKHQRSEIYFYVQPRTNFQKRPSYYAYSTWKMGLAFVKSNSNMSQKKKLKKQIVSVLESVDKDSSGISLYILSVFCVGRQPSRKFNQAVKSLIEEDIIEKHHTSVPPLYKLKKQCHSLKA